MYDIQVEINGSSLRMNHSTGYDIITISGLTGTSARLNTVQSNIGIGEMYTNGTITGTTLNVKGKILDGQTDKKQALIDTVLPLGKGRLLLYQKTVDASRISPYRAIDVVVKETPTITQQYHSKFNFALFAPKPVWKAAAASTITISAPASSNMEKEITVPGQVPAEFDLTITVHSSTLKDWTLYWDDYLGKFLYIDFKKYNTNGVVVGQKVTLKHVDGRLSLDVDGTAANQCIWSQSLLDSFDVGTHKLILSADANTTAYITYYPSYVGVVYDGI